MANNKLSSDIYNISEYIDDIQQTHIPESNNTLSLGIFGYLNDLHSTSLQNTIRMSSEYSNEAIPTKARFEKNVITHSLYLGIKDINAQPAKMNVLLMFPEDYVLARMENNKFRYDHNVKIFIGDYEFHTDYDIIIRKNTITNEASAFTAMYDIDGLNQLSDLKDPYLPPIGRVKYSSTQTMLIIPTFIRQVEYITEFRKILTDNPIENKTMIFEYEDQLACFDIDVDEVGKRETVHLLPVYEGLYDYNTAKYCNYSYIDSNTIRIKFDRDSYEPALNCDVNINIRLTRGSKGNFNFKDEVKIDLISDEINYDGMFMIVKPRGNLGSVDGIDKKSIEELRTNIPKEASAHGSIINTTDLQNFFNLINTDNCKMYFYKHRDNPLERLYYSYIILKSNTNVLPTNTIDIKLVKEQLIPTVEGNLIMKPGTLIYLDPKKDYGVVKVDPTEEEKIQMNKDGFLYINPFMSVLNRSPLYTSYFLNIINVEKDLEFTYINHDSEIQFISSTVLWKRGYFVDRNKYKMTIETIQNINTDAKLIVLDEATGKIVDSKLKIVALIYNDEQTKPLRWIEAKFVEYTAGDQIFKYEFIFETEDIMDDNNRIKIDNMYDLNSNREQYAYCKERVKCQIRILAPFETGEYGRDDTDQFIPGLDGYTLCNKYDISENLEFFYNYSDIVSSALLIKKDESDVVNYTIDRVPLIRDRYINTEKRMMTFVKETELRRKYIENSLLQIEDTFGIDFKFFNTYGPSNLFYMEDKSLINRVNLSITFKMKPVTTSDTYIKDKIIVDIKNYLEDINDITDLHIPNLITQITNTYRDQLIYFEFVDINGYGPGSQHVYRPDTYIGDVVPEFLNINVTDEDMPDINIIVM